MDLLARSLVSFTMLAPDPVDAALAEADCGCTLSVNDTRPEEIASTALDDDPSTATTGHLATSTPDPDPGAPAPTPDQARWEGVLGVEGELTGDGRLIERGALRWEPPMPIRYVASDVGAHDGAQVVGVIETVERREGGIIWGSGPFDLGSEVGREAFRVVDQELTTGVSMDLDDVSFEVRVAAELLEDESLGMPLLLADDSDENTPTLETDADGRVIVATMHSDDEVRVTTAGRVRAATIVAIPAFATAHIATVASEPATDADEQVLAAAEEVLTDALTASAAPLAAPTAWFTDPHLSGPTPLTITAEGRVYGHIAIWGTCHTTHAQGGKCIVPPKSPSNYAHFHLGAHLTAEGREVAVGHLTLATGHADDHMSGGAALAHYDNTATAVADVRAGEDRFGIWVAGTLDPTATPEQVRRLRSSPVSGDWRRHGTGLEMVAALCVNVPGFQVPRPSGLVASGQLVTLTAAGMLPPAKVARPGTEHALSDDDLRYLKRLASRERSSEATDLATRARAAANAMKVRAFVAARTNLTSGAH